MKVFDTVLGILLLKATYRLMAIDYFLYSNKYLEVCTYMRHSNITTQYYYSNRKMYKIDTQNFISLQLSIIKIWTFLIPSLTCPYIIKEYEI